MLKANEVREAFKDFFRQKGHTIVPSAPMVIKDDPTLMFTNAGMNQFKDIILGGRPIEHSRVADSQKCLRVSGKHNDLEEVGHDTYHHTMFEMLGNWSFGDYFKREAIDWAWEFLTDVLHLDPERLYATVFEGSPEEGLEYDAEAADMWKAHLPEDHIIKGNKHDNFWEMGDTGPCGSCSEIHIDLRSEDERAAVSGADLVNKDHPQVIEIWNLVFMQYDRKNDGSLSSLPNKVIDTGMGFERLCMALQGKKSNYDTDVFRPILDKIGELSGHKYGADPDTDIAMRVVADHLRTISFSIADSQLPSNAKAGYVIRRILRRAVRYAYTFLERKEPFMYLLVDTLSENMGDAYPELRSQSDLIKKVIREEEESFLRTLSTGIKLLDSLIESSKKNGLSEISGKDAFTLYDTYGFPLDLTQLILREKGMSLDETEFEAEMKKQKERARNAASVEADDWTVLVADAEQSFCGYDRLETETDILKYRKVTKKGKAYYQVILRETPFYGEMGGQTGDNGELIDDKGESYAVFDTIRETGITVHLMQRLPDNPEGKFIAKVNEADRQRTSANHSATHLLHESLREVLGSHVEQKGSYVSPKSLRFDFSHFQKMTKEEIRQVEHLVNSKIRKAISLDEHRDVPIAEARQMGAMALFGEKYGDKVRTVRFGTSMELCGGTHVANTGSIGMIRILGESSVAAGIRRIEAVTGEEVENMIDRTYDTIHDLSSLLGNSADIEMALRKVIAENEELHGQVQEFMSKRRDDIVKSAIAEAKQIGEFKLIKIVGPMLPDMIKNVAFGVKADIDSSFVFVAGTVDSKKKPLITLMISEDLVNHGLNAAKLVREAGKFIKGGGGGQPFFAQAGGKDPDGISAAVDYIVKAVELI